MNTCGFCGNEIRDFELHDCYDEDGWLREGAWLHINPDVKDRLKRIEDTLDKLLDQTNQYGWYCISCDKRVSIENDYVCKDCKDKKEESDNATDNSSNT